jgi:ABC-2 type transport system permease protein
MTMWKAIAVSRKELRQIVRDRRTLMILLFIPAFFLLVYGYALSWDIRNIRLAVDDRDRSADSRALVSAFTNSGYFDLVAMIDDDKELAWLMDTNTARAVLVIPAGMSRDLEAGRNTPVQILLNGDNANTATTVMAYAMTIVQSESMRVSARRGGMGGISLVSAEPRIWYNPQLRSALFLVPGLIAYIAMITAVVSTALSIVKEKERGTMEQVRMAPVGASTFVIGKTIPFFILSLLSALAIVLVARLLFELPMRGSWPLLLVTLSLFLAGALGLGLLISSIAESQQVAFQLALLSSFLPTLMLSGFIFPIAAMPQALQLVTYVVPARYFLIALRGVVLKGIDISVVWPQLVALAIYAIAMLTLASVRLKRQWA